MNARPRFPFPYAPIRHPEPLAVDQRIAFGRPTANALRFRQINLTEAFTIQDSTGACFRAQLVGMGPRGGEALVYERMARSPEPALHLTLVCAVLARQRMIFVVQKATELGVSRILPVFTERSVGPEGLEHEKAHAWPGQTLRASRQCRRSSVPLVAETVPLTEALESEPWKTADRRYLLDEHAESGAGLDPGPGDVCLAVGPEGGWTDAERALLAAKGAEPLILGPRILRAETAVVVGLTVIQHRLGDLK